MVPPTGSSSITCGSCCTGIAGSCSLTTSGEQDRGRVDNNPLSRLRFAGIFRVLITFLGLGDMEDRAGDTGVFGLGDLEAATDPTSVCRL